MMDFMALPANEPITAKRKFTHTPKASHPTADN
jgi:hypothetical protein